MSLHSIIAHQDLVYFTLQNGLTTTARGSATVWESGITVTSTCLLCRCLSSVSTSSPVLLRILYYVSMNLIVRIVKPEGNDKPEHRKKENK